MSQFSWNFCKNNGYKYIEDTDENMQLLSLYSHADNIIVCNNIYTPDDG